MSRNGFSVALLNSARTFFRRNWHVVALGWIAFCLAVFLFIYFENRRMQECYRDLIRYQNSDCGSYADLFGHALPPERKSADAFRDNLEPRPVDDGILFNFESVVIEGAEYRWSPDVPPPAPSAPAYHN